MSSKFNLLTVTPVLTAGAYSANDMLFVPIEVPNAIPKGKSGILRSLIIIDKDDQELAMDLIIFDSAATTAALNAAEATNDANLAKILQVVSVVAGDYIDFANGQLGQVFPPDVTFGAVLRPSDKEQASLWLAGVTRGTPTHTASGLVIKLGLEIQ